MQDELLERLTALRDDQQADGLATGYERLLDRMAAGDQLLILAQQIARRRTRRHARPRRSGCAAGTESPTIDVAAGAGPIVGTWARTRRPRGGAIGDGRGSRFRRRNGIRGLARLLALGRGEGDVRVGSRLELELRLDALGRWSLGEATTESNARAALYGCTAEPWANAGARALAGMAAAASRVEPRARTRVRRGREISAAGVGRTRPLALTRSLPEARPGAGPRRAARSKRSRRARIAGLPLTSGAAALPIARSAVEFGPRRILPKTALALIAGPWSARSRPDLAIAAGAILPKPARSGAARPEAPRPEAARPEAARMWPFGTEPTRPARTAEAAGTTARSWPKRSTHGAPKRPRAVEAWPIGA